MNGINLKEAVMSLFTGKNWVVKLVIISLVISLGLVPTAVMYFSFKNFYISAFIIKLTVYILLSIYLAGYVTNILSQNPCPLPELTLDTLKNHFKPCLRLFVCDYLFGFFAIILFLFSHFWYLSNRLSLSLSVIPLFCMLLILYIIGRSRIIDTSNLKTGFTFIYNLKLFISGFKAYLIAFILSLGISLLAYALILFLILTLVGIVFIPTVQYIATFTIIHLYTQAYIKGKAKLSL